MKQVYLDYANYNIWANDRLISCLRQQPDALLSQAILGSFPNIRATLLHIWFAETGWLSRLRGEGWAAAEVLDFSGSHAELYVAWQATSAAFSEYLVSADLETLVHFSHKGQDFSIPSREIAQTVFNHGSYHRGQVVLLLRQLGVTEIPQTDYIEWARERERAKLGEK